MAAPDWSSHVVRSTGGARVQWIKRGDKWQPLVSGLTRLGPRRRAAGAVNWGGPRGGPGLASSRPRGAHSAGSRRGGCGQVVARTRVPHGAL